MLAGRGTEHAGWQDQLGEVLVGNALRPVQGVQHAVCEEEDRISSWDGSQEIESCFLVHGQGIDPCQVHHPWVHEYT